jgi:hypothetical protein
MERAARWAGRACRGTDRGAGRGAAATPAAPAPEPRTFFAPVGRAVAWPLDRHGRPWPRSRFGQPMCPIDELPPGRKPGEAPGPGQSYDVMRDAIKAWRAAQAVFADPGRFAGIVRTAVDQQTGQVSSGYGTLTQAQTVKPEEEDRGLVEKLVDPAAAGGDDASGGGHSGNSATQLADWRTISGQASYYDLPGNLMANGQPFDSSAMSAAMLGVPLGTVVTVSLAGNPARSITVRITDRGPYVTGRVIDLSPAAFVALVGSLDIGVARVVVTVP